MTIEWLKFLRMSLHTASYLEDTSLPKRDMLLDLN
jgi:hypothetical protein